MTLRRAALPAVIALLIAGSAAPSRAQDNYQFADPNVEDLMRYARQAVGGGAVPKLRTLELKGRSKVDLSGTLLDCTVNIKLLLPDHYLRVDTTRTDAKLAGFSGKNVLNAIRAGEQVSVPPANLHSAILKNEQARLARLLLGALTYVTPNVSMIFVSSGLQGGLVDPRESAATIARAEGRGEPNAAEIRGSNRFTARIVMDSVTRMPLRLQYPSDGKQETMTFEDRREVSGLKLPFRVTTAVGGRVIDQLLFDEILINPEIGKADFTKR